MVVSEKCYILLTARAVNEILRQQERMCNKLAKVDFEQWNGFKVVIVGKRRSMFVISSV